VRKGQGPNVRQAIDFMQNRKPVPFGASQQLLEKSGWREEKTTRRFATARQVGQQIQAANGAEPGAFAPGIMRQRIYSVRKLAEGRKRDSNLLTFEANKLDRTWCREQECPLSDILRRLAASINFDFSRSLGRFTNPSNYSQKCLTVHRVVRRKNFLFNSNN